jgi:hypothetical protein
MKISTKIEFKEYRQLMFILTYRRPGMIIVTVAGLIILISALISYVIIHLPLQSVSLIPLFLGLYIILLPIFVFYNSKKVFKSNSRLHELITYEFTPDKILMTGESFKSEMDWMKIYKIQELSRWILIYQSRATANLILKESFNNEQLIDFRKLVINNNIKNNFKGKRN